MMNGVKVYALLLSVVFAQAGMAQKKPLTIDSYKEWKKVDSPEISDDGKWVSYRISGADDYNYGSPSCLYLYNTNTRKTLTLPGVSDASFWGKGNWMSYTVRDTAEGTKDTTIVLNLRNMKKIVWNKSGELRPLSKSELVSWCYPAVTVPADTVAKTREKSYTRLVIMNMATGDSVRIDSVTFHTFYDNNQSIAYIKDQGGAKSICFGKLKGKHRILYTEPAGGISSFQLNPARLEGTFSVASDSLIYAFSLKDNSCKLIVNRNDIPVPEGHYVRRLDLSDNQKFVTYELGTVNKAAPAKKGKPDKSFELELWTWDEDVPQSRQAINGYNPRASYPRYICHLDDKRNFQLAAATVERIEKPYCPDYNYVITLDQTAYHKYRDWKENLNYDASLVNINTGETKPLMENLTETPEWSPNGKYALIYSPDNKAWYKLDTSTEELTDISAQIGYPVYNEDHDKPCAARSYGIAGWSDDGNKIIIYDRYDMWVIDLTGKEKAYMFTAGYGRKNQKCIRMLSTNYEPRTLNLKADNLVGTFDEKNKNEGIYVLSPGGRMRQLMEGPYGIRIFKVSDDQNACIFQRQSYTEFRDLWWSKMDFSRPQKVTEVNPQQKDYKWGTVELVKWTNYEGKENEGLLYLPENYDRAKKYPMLVQFYETHTGEMNVYHVPALSAAMADITTYVSNDYIVFMPDVHFTIGSPGQSCYDAVVSGTQMLIDKGIADKDHIGLQGHSWSGYQTSYLVTKTNMFRCANIGAPIVDMVSGYVGIRNGSGLIRFFMYEDTQSRMGKSIWDYKEGYLRNSPLMEADKITTPLLIFHCDADEAVAYEQGRGLYLAMRRLQRPAWLLNYKNDHHFLSNEAAQRDWTIRMEQFFDHYLKDKPMPRWMKEGININERGIDQKYDYVK